MLFSQGYAGLAQPPKNPSAEKGRRRYAVDRSNLPTTTRRTMILPVRIVNAATGELLRELTLDPARNYQPTGKPKGGSRPRT